jgi:ATP-dependent DNA ligase
MRIIAKNLRIGMSDKTMDLFFSVPALGGNNGENKNVRGGSMLSSINNQYYFIEPMLAKPLKSVEDVFEFCGKKEQKYLIADVKYDGERTLICYERGK